MCLVLRRGLVLINFENTITNTIVSVAHDNNILSVFVKKL